MRIGISCNRFGSGGGLERYALDLTAGLRDLPGIAVEVFARRIDPGAPIAGLARITRIPVGWLPNKLKGPAFSWILRRLRRECDVLIGCNRVRGSEIAICGGTHLGYLAARGVAPGFFDRLEIRLETGQYKDASLVIAHSQRMERELGQLYRLPSGRIRLIYPPVDRRRFSPASDDERRALRARFGFGDRIILLFPSSGHARKGLDVLAAAVARSPHPVELVVAGRPVGRPLPRVRELGYQSNVEDLYRAADFTVLASDYEPFGLVGVESVLCGTPLVFADNIACLEVIEDDAFESFDRANPVSLDAAIDRAVERVRSGSARLGDPHRLLRYDPSPAVHALRVLELAREIGR
jgi:glycosyltransferase involved in cell wall biosynthesis